ncbi:hypothetical protein [Cupriavidus pauculus]|uniref:hypothetical protein n=1 Tax=Cupriavidus pauculus TaxID=82633 RepID=UPI001EE392C3|nr:hypothetical protein [Cupriavidus pauculus]GJG95692.1 hypothetical protein CBA19C6_14405 [Cupriavidus pauculus]
MLLNISTETPANTAWSQFSALPASTVNGAGSLDSRATTGAVSGAMSGVSCHASSSSLIALASPEAQAAIAPRPSNSPLGLRSSITICPSPVTLTPSDTALFACRLMPM